MLVFPDAEAVAPGVGELASLKGGAKQKVNALSWVTPWRAFKMCLLFIHMYKYFSCPRNTYDHYGRWKGLCTT